MSNDPGLHKNQNLLDKIQEYDWRQTMVYLFLVLVVVFALGLDRSNRIRDDRERCQAGVDYRNVQRATVDAVYQLATGLIGESSRPQTQEETVATNRFIREANSFRHEMYDKIQPSDSCLEYVNDVNVQPPSPDVPLFPKIPKNESTS